MAAVRRSHVLPVYSVMPEPEIPGQAYLIMARAGGNLHQRLQQGR